MPNATTRPFCRTSPNPDLEARVEAYLATLLSRLQDVFAERVTGAYAIGSLALGGFAPGHSDIDVIAVVEGIPTTAEKRAVVTALRHPHLECPSRGLEFVLYREAAVRTPDPGAAFEINLNTGPAMPFSCSFDPASEPAHWFVLDRSIARSRGVELFGPAASDLFAPLPMEWLLRALIESLDWHLAHESAGTNLVLNAARSWRFAREGAWSSKVEAAAWAKARDVDASVVDAALERRGGGRAELDQDDAEAFAALVRNEIARELGSP